MKQKSLRNDLKFDDTLFFRKLEKAFLKQCRYFGYQEIKTSTIEPLHIFTSLGTLSDEKLKRMYSFIDWDGWSGERVVLKPDSATCVARFYTDHLYGQNPRQKLCYVENHFEWADARDGLSERWQCGIENIGNPDTKADIEVIYMAYMVLMEIGFKDVHLYLSYPACIKALIDLFHTKEQEKKELEAAMKNMDTARIKALCNSDEEVQLFENLLLADGSAGLLKNLQTQLQGARFKPLHSLLDHFMRLCESLDKLKCPYKIDFSRLGDLKYYTGIWFQFRARPTKKPDRDILCAGGRYDNLISDMIRLLSADPQAAASVPAVGFAFYVRNILNERHIIKPAGAMADNRQNISIYISNISERNVATGQRLSDKLLRLGFAPRITFNPLKREQYENFGLVIEVDHASFDDGFQILFSRKIGKPLLMNLFGEFNGR